MAEIGVNYGGDWETLKEMIHDAAESGVDACKFQYYNSKAIQDVEKKNPHSLYTDRTFRAIKEAELSLSDLKRVKELCTDADVEFMCTPFMTVSRIDQLNPLVRRWKIRERDGDREDMIKAALKTGKDVIISKTRYNEGWLNPQIKQVFCIPKYPAMMEDLRNMGLDLNYLTIFEGYSNHVKDDGGAILAVCAAQLYRGYNNWFYLEIHHMLKGTDPIDKPVSYTGDAIKKIVEVLRTWEHLAENGTILRDVSPYIRAS